MAAPNDRWKKMIAESHRKLDKMAKEKSGNKYSAKSQYYNGQFYHSAGEAEYANGLDLRKKAGDIKSWRRQVKIDLTVKGKHITNYFMDFEITHNDGTIELVEYKGMETSSWKQKFQLLEALKDELYPNGVTITLVKHKSKYKPKSTWNKSNRK